MGAGCCKAIRSDSHELDLDTSDSKHSREQLEQEGFGKLAKSKTMTRKKRNGVRKCDTNAVGFNPGTFVLETQGLLDSNYDFLCKLGEGNEAGNCRNLRNCVQDHA